MRLTFGEATSASTITSFPRRSGSSTLNRRQKRPLLTPGFVTGLPCVSRYLDLVFLRLFCNVLWGTNLGGGIPERQHVAAGHVEHRSRRAWKVGCAGAVPGLTWWTPVASTVPNLRVPYRIRNDPGRVLVRPPRTRRIPCIPGFQNRSRTLYRGTTTLNPRRGRRLPGEDLVKYRDNDGDTRRQRRFPPHLFRSIVAAWLFPVSRYSCSRSCVLMVMDATSPRWRRGLAWPRRWDWTKPTSPSVFPTARSFGLQTESTARRSILQRAGLLERLRRGVYKVTDRGRELLQT